MSSIRVFFTIVTFASQYALLLPTPAPVRSPSSDFRKSVICASTAVKKGEAYQQWFEKLDRAGFTDLANDEDVSIALQASWELHKKSELRGEHITLRTDQIYNEDELKRFVKHLEKVTKAPIPAWWSNCICKVDCFPKEHHAFEMLKKLPIYKSDIGYYVPKVATLMRDQNTLTVSAGGFSAAIPAKFDLRLVDYLPVAISKDERYVAACSTYAGSPFQVARLDHFGQKAIWISDVWAVRRGVSTGPAHHLVEIAPKGDTVFVFGAETHGMYLEAFQSDTGKCLYRFCTCYWFNFSEKWNLK